MDIIIKSPADLPKVEQLNSWLSRPLIRRVEIELQQLSSEEAKKAEKKVKYLFNDCGCFYGELVMLSFLSWKIIPLVIAGTFEWNLLWFLLPMAILLGIIGKFVGLYWSYQRLNFWLDKLKNT